MNENQHDASVAVQMAQGRVNILSDELTQARKTLRKAQKTLDSAIRRDPSSWYGTPGISQEQVGS